MKDNINIQNIDEKAVTVGFCGKINSDNAAAVSTSLETVRNEHPQGRLVFDFSDLEYISSAGLRSILRMAKKEQEKIKITGISPEIMEILDVTGFVELFETHRKIRKYDLSALEMIASGANGEVYRVDKDTIIKVFQKSAPAEVIERERELARKALLLGIPTAISYSLVYADDRQGIAFEMLDADTLSCVLKNDPGKYDLLIKQYIDLYKEIHGTKADKNVFPSIKDIYYSAMDECREYYSEEEMQQLRSLVDSVPERDTLIHGDYHPNNVMVQDGELILIDMGDLSYGHPVFDFLATAATQVNLVKLDPAYAEFHTKMPAEMITRAWRSLIDSYFADRDETERGRIEEQICLFSKLKVALAPAFGRGAAPEIIKASIDDARANFFPHISELVGSIDW